MKEKIKPYLVPFSIVIAGVIIAGAVFLAGQKSGLVSGPGQGEKTANQKDSVSIEGEPILGNAQAKVTMIEFSDFQCPFCQRHAFQTFPELKKQYIDAGKVKMVFRNLPLPIHSNAQLAAEAGECAFEQDKFWEYKDKLFQDQEKLGRDDLKQYALDLGLDAGKFNNCLDSRKYENEVKADAAEAQELGIKGTPTFVINGTLIEGAYPFSEFQKVIEEKLK